LDRLTYKNYVEDISAIKGVYEAKLNMSKPATATATPDIVKQKENIFAIEEINRKLESIAKDISLQFDNRQDNYPKIINPSESEVTEEWVNVSGIGAPPNYKIFLFTWLKNKFSSLQMDISTSDINGNWHDQKCHLQNISAYREIYVIAIEPEKVNMAFNLYREYGKRINPIIFQTILLKNKIKCTVSIGKRLIRLAIPESSVTIK
jgi:hypothetical protein